VEARQAAATAAKTALNDEFLDWAAGHVDKEIA
jgi:hypothetical protein